MKIAGAVVKLAGYVHVVTTPCIVQANHCRMAAVAVAAEDTACFRRSVEELAEEAVCVATAERWGLRVTSSMQKWCQGLVLKPKGGEVLAVLQQGAVVQLTTCSRSRSLP